MAHDGKGTSPWIWILGAVLLILLAAYFASVVPEDTGTSAGTTQRATMQQGDPKMIGVWQSSDDSKFTREFKADGTVVDRYEGDDLATAMGTWMIVDPTKEPSDALGAPSENLTGMTVVKLTFSDGQILYFGVDSVTESSLKLIYIGRGNTLSFTKVQ